MRILRCTQRLSPLTIPRYNAGAPGHLPLIATFGVLFATCCASFYRAIVRDPGYSRLPEDDEELKEVRIPCGVRRLILTTVRSPLQVIEDLTSRGCLNGTAFCISCMVRDGIPAPSFCT